MDPLMAGAAAGVIATAPMTAAMATMHRQIPEEQRHPLPPEQITEALSEAAGVEIEGEPAETAAALAAHFLYGGAAGALYAPVAERLRLPPAASGMALGLAVWTVSYLGWLPALGVRPPATERPASENALMIAAHLVWGAVLGVTAHRLLEDGKRGM
jgi:uncharacterized membrane protein YagU involved in acid resistance